MVKYNIDWFWSSGLSDIGKHQIDISTYIKSWEGNTDSESSQEPVKHKRHSDHAISDTQRPGVKGSRANAEVGGSFAAIFGSFYTCCAPWKAW